MNPPPFQPANKLEQVLVSAVTDPSERAEFYHQMLQAELFLLTPDAPEQKGRRTLEAPANVSFVNLSGPDGAYLPIFTSQQRLQDAVNQSGKTFGFLAMRGADLFPILTQHPQSAILNPGAAYGKELTPDEIRQIADGSIFQTKERVIQKETKVLLGQPARYPTELVSALTCLFQQHEAVRAAYLAQIHDPSSGEKPHLIVGIETAEDFKKIVGEAGMTAQGALQNGDFVDFVQVGGNSGAFDSYFKKQTSPFYQVSRKKPFWKVW